MARPKNQFVPLAPTFLATLPPRVNPRVRCAVCGKRGGIPREEAKGQPVCPDCYHEAATRKLLEVGKAKLFAWLAGR